MVRLSPLSPSDLEKRLIPQHGIPPISHHQPPHFPDTLAKGAPNTTSLDFSPSKPHLPSLPEMRAIRAMERLHEAGERKFHVHIGEFDAKLDELDAWQAQSLETLKEKCQRTQETTMWETARKIGAGILGVVSTFLGLSIVTTGGSALIGGALIASGIISIANLAFTDAGLWDWLAEKLAGDNEEMQKKIATLIPCVLGLIAAGLGMAGFGALARWGALPVAPQALAIVQMIVNLTTIVTTIGGELSQARVSLSQSSLIDLQGKIALHSHEVDLLNEQLEEVLEQETQSYRLAKSLLNLTIHTKQALLV